MVRKITDCIESERTLMRYVQKFIVGKEEESDSGEEEDEQSEEEIEKMNIELQNK